MSRILIHSPEDKPAIQQIGILNGPNLNLLGKREPKIYGGKRFEVYLHALRLQFEDVSILYFQSNHEGDLIDQIQKWGFSLSGIVCNAGAYTHSSIAIADAIRAISSPVVEVHISDTNKREEFRKKSFMRPHCIHHIIGHGVHGYEEAIRYLINR
ncbi:MAG: type II 3-dehydroquinate dehydratase [Bacteroidetes bacterium]|jgi:3-dehydroquinate dehydratase-2|nr:type II 3-dehydroquinate dehydratase [Bacteroidota bacterium]